MNPRVIDSSDDDLSDDILEPFADHSDEDMPFRTSEPRVTPCDIVHVDEAYPDDDLSLSRPQAPLKQPAPTLPVEIMEMIMAPIVSKRDLTACCRVSKRFRKPTKLVLKGGSPYHVAFQTPGLPRTLFARICEIVLVTRPKCLRSRSSSYKPMTAGQLPALRRLVWILHTKQPWESWGPASGNPSKPSRAVPVLFDFKPMSKAIAAFPDARVLIVNTESLDPRLFDYRRMRRDERRPFFKRRLFAALEAVMEAKGKTLEDIAAKEATIEFFTMPEYLQSENWSGEFDEAEVESWLV